MGKYVSPKVELGSAKNVKHAMNLIWNLRTDHFVTVVTTRSHKIFISTVEAKRTNAVVSDIGPLLEEHETSATAMRSYSSKGRE